MRTISSMARSADSADPILECSSFVTGLICVPSAASRDPNRSVYAERIHHADCVNQSCVDDTVRL